MSGQGAAFTEGEEMAGEPLSPISNRSEDPAAPRLPAAAAPGEAARELEASPKAGEASEYSLEDVLNKGPSGAAPAASGDGAADASPRAAPLPPPAAGGAGGAAPAAPAEEDAPLPLCVPGEPRPAPPGRLQRAATTAQRAQRRSEQICDGLSETCSPSCCDWVGRVPSIYCQKLALHPWAFALFYALVLVIAVSVLWREVEVNTQIDSFYKVDADAALRQDVYLEAVKGMRPPSSASDLADRTTFELSLYYRAKGGGAAGGRVLSEAALRDIRNFERDLLSGSEWSSMCGKSGAPFRCSPGESIGNYVWPTRQDEVAYNSGVFQYAGGEFGLTFDGTARERLHEAAVVAYLQADTQRGTAAFLPAWGSDPRDSAELRSTFAFTAPSADSGQFSDEYDAFVRDVLYDKLLDGVERSRKVAEPDTWEEESSVTIFFSGDVVDDYDVKVVFYRDMKLAAGCLVFTFLFAWFHLRSLFLAFFGVWLLCMAPLLSFVLLPAVDKPSLASFLCVFIVVGLGGNTLLYAKSEWDLSARKFGRAPSARRLLRVHQDILWQLMPVLLSAVCFFVLLLSLLRPLREMGLFAGVSMLLTALLCVLVFVPLLVVNEQLVRPAIQRGLPQRVQLVLEPPTDRIAWKLVARGCVEAASRGKWPLVAAAAVVAVMMGIAIGVAFTRHDVGLPEIFSPDHHRAARRELEGKFSAPYLADESPPEQVKICEPQVTGDCGMFWCEAPAQGHASAPAADTCECRRGGSVGTACGTVRVSARLSGASAISSEHLVYSLQDHVEAKAQVSANQASWRLDGAADGLLPEAVVPTTLKPLVLENWESGEIDVESLIEMPGLVMDNAGAAGSQVCDYKLLCHCGSRACQRPVDTTFSGQETIDIVVNTSRRLAGATAAPLEAPRRADADSEASAGAAAAAAPWPAAGRRLSTLGTGLPSVVTVLFGISPPGGSEFLDTAPQWSFDGTFDAASPAAQRAMLRMCEMDDATKQELNIQEVSCWLKDFRDDMESRLEKFPVCRQCNFTGAVTDFVAGNPRAAQSIWFDEAGNVMATMFSFTVGARSTVEEHLEDEKRWLAHVSTMNLEAESTASQAWATSQTWVDAEAFDEALSSSWRVVLVTLALLTVAALAYTLDLKIVAAITLLTFCCGTVLSFMMYCVFQWKFGPWELVITVLFACYSLEPALRMSSIFLSPGRQDEAAPPQAHLALPAPEPAPLRPLPEVPAGGGEPPAEAPEVVLPPPPPLETAGEGAKEGEGQDQAASREAMSSSSVEPAGAGGSSMAGTDALPPSPARSRGEEDAGGPAAPAASGAAPAADGDGREDAAAAPCAPAGPQDTDVKAVLTSALESVLADSVMVALKLLVCGIFLASCELRLFSRLGVLSVCLPLLWLPAMLYGLPAIILLSGRTDREPDCKRLWRYLAEVVQDWD